MQMQYEWKRLEGYLQKREPEVLAKLLPPASHAEIVALEQQLSVKLPVDFVACLSQHNGQSGPPGLFGGLQFLSTERIGREWRIWKQLLDEGEFCEANAKPDSGIKAEWWNSSWIPFTSNGAGDHLCLDLSPAAGGHIGQVIAVFHDDSARILKDDSFSGWFTRFVTRKLENRS